MVVREPVDEVADRAERPRRREVVAASDHDRRVVRGLVGEAADERRLPDPGLARHAHQASRPTPRRAEGSGQLRQRLVALEQGERVDVVECRWGAHLAPLVASPLVHPHDHAIAAAVGRRDDGLARPVVADGAAGGLDPTRQRGLADEAVTPDRVEQLLLADDPFGMGGQVDQHVEDLGLDRHEHAGAVQLVAVEIELAVAEGEDHTRPPRRRQRPQCREPRGPCPSHDVVDARPDRSRRPVRTGSYGRTKTAKKSRVSWLSQRSSGPRMSFSRREPWIVPLTLL